MSLTRRAVIAGALVAPLLPMLPAEAGPVSYPVEPMDAEEIAISDALHAEMGQLYDTMLASAPRGPWSVEAFLADYRYVLALARQYGASAFIEIRHEFFDRVTSELLYEHWDHETQVTLKDIGNTPYWQSFTWEPIEKGEHIAPLIFRVDLDGMCGCNISSLAEAGWLDEPAPADV